MIYRPEFNYLDADVRKNFFFPPKKIDFGSRFLKGVGKVWDIATKVTGGTAAVVILGTAAYGAWKIREHFKNRSATNELAEAVEDFYGDSEGAVEEVEETVGEGDDVRVEKKKRYHIYNDGALVVSGKYMCHVAAVCREKFYGSGFTTKTENACRHYAARMMREHGMRECDIMDQVPRVLTVVWFVTKSERKFEDNMRLLNNARLIKKGGVI
ncbi:hypothetical protein 1 [Sanxia tombus-like virus 4]|uniref:hypothetical protein 1 n=1 Tax=Sanxia tombus-like virus 4 TaxID=1923388 RepID=UPI00090C3383|nr:hypothetical protein 1 [Sanxia tombus-like virus 4]APG76431.1 hypothetical protein 1 [Sanxia tombus-like virus 4]